MNAIISNPKQSYEEKGIVDFISLSMEKWYELSIRINWLAIVILIIVVWIILCIYRK